MRISQCVCVCVERRLVSKTIRLAGRLLSARRHECAIRDVPRYIPGCRNCTPHAQAPGTLCILLVIPRKRSELSLRRPLVSHIQKIHAPQVKAPDKLCRRHAVLRFSVRKYYILLLVDCVNLDIADGVFAFHYQSHISVTSIPCFSMSIFFFIL